MSGHVGWIERGGLPLERAFSALDVSLKLAVERGKSDIMRAEKDGLAIISLVALLSSPRPVINEHVGLRQFPIQPIALDSSRLLQVKGLLPRETTAAQWAIDNALNELRAIALLAHVTAAEPIDRTLISPGPAVLIDAIAGAPVGQISAFAELVLNDEPTQIDVLFDSGVRLVEHVAELTLSQSLQRSLRTLSNSELALHCSFIDFRNLTVGLLNTRRSASNQSFPPRLWFAGHHGHWCWGNDQKAVESVHSNSLASSVTENTVAMLP
jgi:hypothetical protein